MNRQYSCVLLFFSILHDASGINYQCSVCPIGKFKSATSNNECVLCPANSYQDALGASSATQCKPCPSNSFAPAGSGRSSDCLCGLGFSGDVANYSTGSRNLNLQRSCGATLTDACDTLHSSTGTLASSNAVDLDIGTYSLTSGAVEGERPWWRVKFEREVIVQSLEIYNSDALKMSGFSIRVGKQNAVCAENIAWPGGDTVQVTCTQALQGQYLYIINGVETPMLMNNVQVVGYLLPPSEACVACAGGQYKATNGTATCTACAAGTASATLAAVSVSSCTLCAENTYAGAGAPACTACPQDSSTNSTGSESLALCNCNPGFAPAPSGVGCEACPPGTYKASDKNTPCIDCVAGTYRDFPAATAESDCIGCPANTYAGAGAPACTACPEDSSTNSTGSESLALCNCNPGFAPAPSGVGCEACPPGTYKASDKNTPCIDCVAGKYRVFAAATAQSDCIGCPANTFSLSRSTEATNCSCNAGYSGTANGVACVACIAGTYKTAAGIGTCTNCAANEYSTTEAQVTATCPSCPSSSQAPAGSDEAIDCRCNVGYTGANGQVCLGCEPGTYKPTVGPDACTLCGSNTYSPAVAASSSSVCLACQGNSTSRMGSTRHSDCDCLKGYLTNNLGAANATCQICSAGSFNSQQNATTCSKCGAGYQSLTPGAVSEEQCVQCGVDTYSAAGAAQCDICPQNTFAPGRSAQLSDCRCLAGYYSAVIGQDGRSCSACQAGKHKALAGAMPCTDCLRNFYSTATAATSNATCVPCTTNAVSMAGSSNATMCLCDFGYAGSNAAGCAACIAGKFKASSGPALCTDCKANTYSDLAAQTSNATCTPCYDNSVSLAGSDHIDDCSCAAGFEFS